MLSKLELGQSAEDWVAAQLRAQGWRILARNWRKIGTEMDIIANKGRTLVGVEVRSRSQPRQSHADIHPWWITSGQPTISRRKSAALLRGLRLFSTMHRGDYDSVRLDLALVCMDEQARPLAVDYWAGFLNP